MKIKQINGEIEEILFQESKYDFFTDEETKGINEWAKHIDNINVLLSDFHDNVAQVIYLNGAEEYSIDVRNVEAISTNFHSKYGIGTKVWYKVVTAI
jgi:hypothetical protein